MCVEKIPFTNRGYEAPKQAKSGRSPDTTAWLHVSLSRGWWTPQTRGCVLRWCACSLAEAQAKGTATKMRVVLAGIKAEAKMCTETGLSPNRTQNWVHN